jgi:hypothetical protein
MRSLLQQGKEIPCPYCAQLIAKDAFVCSQCQGVLAIGSWEAIRLAIHLEPTLANRDAETIERLTIGVRDIDEYWAEQAAELAEAQRLSEQKRIDDENQRRREAEMAREESIRASEEARKVAAAKEQARIEALGPFRKWCALHKPLLAAVTGCLIVVIASFHIKSVYQANALKDKAIHVKELKLQAKEVAAIKRSCTSLVPKLTAQLPKLKQNKISYFSVVNPYRAAEVKSYYGYSPFSYKDYGVEKSVKQTLASWDAQRDQSLKILTTSGLQNKYTRVKDSSNLKVLANFRTATTYTKSSAWVSKNFWTVLKTSTETTAALQDTSAFFTSISEYDDPTKLINPSWIGGQGQGPFPTYLGLESSWTDLIKTCKAIR